MTRDQLRRAVQSRVKASGLSARNFVTIELGLSEGWSTMFGRFLDGGKPRPSLLKALGYRLVKAEDYIEVGPGRAIERRPAHR